MKNPISPYVLLIIAIIIFAVTPYTYAEDICAYTNKYDKQIQKSVRRHWGLYLAGLHWTEQKALLAKESSLNPDAENTASGAVGLGQFLLPTWEQVSSDLGLRGNRRSSRDAIEASAYYLANNAAFWTSPRPVHERYMLALASYNWGRGNVYKLQIRSGMEPYWTQMVPYGAPEETINYVERIPDIAKQMRNCPDPRSRWIRR